MFREHERANSSFSWVALEMRNSPRLQDKLRVSYRGKLCAESLIAGCVTSADDNKMMIAYNISN
jgi:hypothetical protein